MFPGGGTHILRDMCVRFREHISQGICVSQVTGGKSVKVAGDGAGFRRILTTLAKVLEKSLKMAGIFCINPDFN